MEHKVPQAQEIVSTLAFLTSKTWRDDETYEIIEQGWKQAHGNYFLYVFEMRKPVGVDPWGFPSKKLAIYYSWRPEYGDKFKIISAYPFSEAFYVYQRNRRMGLY